jgi:hypothetical protein
MELDFRFDQVVVWMSPENGISLHCSVSLTADSKSFALKSGQPLRDALFSIHIHPLSQSPQKDKNFADGRIGEISLRILHKTAQGRRLFGAWIHVPDDQFNVLYTEVSKRDRASNLISLCFNEGETAALTDAVFDDIGLPSSGIQKIPIMTYRMFITVA